MVRFDRLNVNRKGGAIWRRIGIRCSGDITIRIHRKSMVCRDIRMRAETIRLKRSGHRNGLDARIRGKTGREAWDIAIRRVRRVYR